MKNGRAPAAVQEQKETIGLEQIDLNRMSLELGVSCALITYALLEPPKPSGRFTTFMKAIRACDNSIRGTESHRAAFADALSLCKTYPEACRLIEVTASQTQEERLAIMKVIELAKTSAQVSQTLRFAVDYGIEQGMALRKLARFYKKQPVAV